MVKDEAADVIGDALIPVINKLQDIFSQVRRVVWRCRSQLGSELGFALIIGGSPGNARRTPPKAVATSPYPAVSHSTECHLCPQHIMQA